MNNVQVRNPSSSRVETHLPTCPFTKLLLLYFCSSYLCSILLLTRRLAKRYQPANLIFISIANPESHWNGAELMNSSRTAAFAVNNVCKDTASLSSVSLAYLIILKRSSTKHPFNSFRRALDCNQSLICISTSPAHNQRSLESRNSTHSLESGAELEPMSNRQVGLQRRNRVV